MQMDFGKALLDPTQQTLEPVDCQIGMQSALHENSGAPKFDRLSDLAVDSIEIEDVSLGSQLALQRTIKSAERAVLSAEIRVINVAIDDVGDDTFRMQLAAHGIGFHSNANQVIGAEHIESLLSGQGHVLRTILREV